MCCRTGTYLMLYREHLLFIAWFSDRNLQAQIWLSHCFADSYRNYELYLTTIGSHRASPRTSGMTIQHPFIVVTKEHPITQFSGSHRSHLTTNWASHYHSDCVSTTLTYKQRNKRAIDSPYYSMTKYSLVLQHHHDVTSTKPAEFNEFRQHNTRHTQAPH